MIRKPSNQSGTESVKSRVFDLDGQSQMSGQLTGRNFAPDKS
jgi:hypothetical protein